MIETTCAPRRQHARDVAPALPRACAHCPWRKSNQGKPHPDGWYRLANLRRLWRGLRNGDPMTCHPTDPYNPVPPGAQPVPEGVVTHECTGATILQQREAAIFNQLAVSDPTSKTTIRDYRRLRPRGLSQAGLIEIILNRGLFGGVPILGGKAQARPDLMDPDVGYAPLDGWEGPLAEAIESQRGEMEVAR